MRKISLKISMGNNDYDILYRGGCKYPSLPVLWLTTSRSYAAQYGEVHEVKVKLGILDKLADAKTALNYLMDTDLDEYPLYDSENVDISRMKGNGYTGYYYQEDEYKCLNVCLIQNSIIMKKELTEKIDWIAYRKELEQTIKNERLYCMGGGNDVALHEKNMEELVEELDNINNGLYRDIIDKYDNYMGNAAEYFERFFIDKEKVDWDKLRERTENFIQDALEANDEYTFEHVQGLEVDLEYVENKNYDKLYEKYGAKFFDLSDNAVNVNDRISDVSFRDADGGRKFIRCKIDGQPQLSVKMSFNDTVLYEKGLITPDELAEIYFKDELQEEQSRGLKR